MSRAERPADPPPEGPDGPSDSIVDEASEESFPASDPPAWDPTHAGLPAPPGGHASAKSVPPRADEQAE